MKKRILCLLLALLMSASLLVIPAMADSSRGASTKAALNMRSEANTQSTIIITMPKGSDVLVLSHEKRRRHRKLNSRDLR